MVTTPAWRRLQRIDFSDTDYPGVIYRAPAQNFRVPPSPRTIKYIIIHITGGAAQNEGPAINTFRNGPASAHYIVNRQGHITQFVREAHIANHVDFIGSVTNRDSIGIEHVNQWDDVAELRPTDAQYASSARLVAWLCYKYDIPDDHNPVRHQPGIRGHIEEQPESGHSRCPNPAWEWGKYIPLVKRFKLEISADPISSLVR